MSAIKSTGLGATACSVHRVVPDHELAFIAMLRIEAESGAFVALRAVTTDVTAGRRLFRTDTVTGHRGVSRAIGHCDQRRQEDLAGGILDPGRSQENVRLAA